MAPSVFARDMNIWELLTPRDNELSIFVCVLLASFFFFLYKASISIASVFAVYNCVMDIQCVKMMFDILTLLMVDFPYSLTLPK
jgi:hypothetical protein